MKYKDILEKLGVLRKFHTSNQKDKIIFYRGQDNNNGTLTIVLSEEEDIIDSFNLRDIELMSLSTKDGLLIHYGDKEHRSLHPFGYEFDDILIDLRN